VAEHDAKRDAAKPPEIEASYPEPPHGMTTAWLNVRVKNLLRYSLRGICQILLSVALLTVLFASFEFASVHDWRKLFQSQTVIPKGAPESAAVRIAEFQKQRELLASRLLVQR
jgi:hypothetical protein